MSSLSESIVENDVCPIRIIDLNAVMLTQFNNHPGLESFLQDEEGLGDCFPDMGTYCDEPDIFLSEARGMGRIWLVKAATQIRAYETKDNYRSTWGMYRTKWFKGVSYGDCMEQAILWAGNMHEEEWNKANGVATAPPHDVSCFRA